MAELITARRRRGVAISSITQLEKHVLELEGKESLSYRHKIAIRGYIKHLENLDPDFKGFHCTVICLVEEDEQVVMKEQAKLDDNEDRVTDLKSRLLDLRAEEKKVAATSVANPSKPFESG